MAIRKKMKSRYRRFPYLSDFAGMKSAIGEMRGFGFPKQPPLNRTVTPPDDETGFDEQWFINEIKRKIATHAENCLEYPYSTDPIFDEQGRSCHCAGCNPPFNKKRYPNVGWASPWSHRHIAYAAGLGTFGMHDFLITEKGCAHRLGSFVVHRRLSPNRRRPDDIHAYCLQYQGKQCLKCARRCPAGAITAENAHDKEACYKHVANSLKYCLKNYHIFIYGCGLCATGVPCESGIPVKQGMENRPAPDGVK